MTELFGALPRKALIGCAAAALVAVAAIVLMGARHNRPMVSHAATSTSSILAEEASR